MLLDLDGPYVYQRYYERRVNTGIYNQSEQVLPLEYYQIDRYFVWNLENPSFLREEPRSCNVSV